MNGVSDSDDAGPACGVLEGGKGMNKINALKGAVLLCFLAVLGLAVGVGAVAGAIAGGAVAGVPSVPSAGICAASGHVLGTTAGATGPLSSPVSLAPAAIAVAAAEAPAFLTAPPGAGDQFISFKLDGREVRMTRVKLFWYSDNHVTFDGSFKDRVDLGEKSSPRVRNGEISVSFPVAPEGSSFVGTHRVGPSDMVPVYVSWYEVVKQGGSAGLVERIADLDSAVEGQFLSVTFENFGAAGTLVKGVFSAVLKGNDGKLHSIDDGRFALVRRNAAE